MVDKQKKIYLYFCSSNGNKDLITEKYNRVENREITTVSLPCSGKINIPYMLKAFETGADGVVLVGCQKGGCRNLMGNLRAEKRVGAVDGLLQEIGLEKDRIKIVHIDDEEPSSTFSAIDDFKDSILN